MTKTEKKFLDAIRSIVETSTGQEAAMYGPIRDLFCDVLGYPKPKVHIDIAGEAGRPDVTCRAPSGLTDAKGNDIDIDWTVVEAKAEHGAFSNESKREVIFAEKSKYITPDTAWFVMVEPNAIIARPTMVEPNLITARPTMSGHSISANDLNFKTDGSQSLQDFITLFARMKYDLAGVPKRLKSFRAGDVSLIATDKLICDAGATRRTENKVKLARRHFYTALQATTQALQENTLAALKETLPEIEAIRKEVAEFQQIYGPSDFNPYTLRISACPASRELAKTYPSAAAKLSRDLKRRGSISRLALNSLPSFEHRISTQSEAQTYEMFATETANLVLARILLIRFLEDHKFFGEHRYLCNGGVQAFQSLRDTFEQGYTRLLQMAYEKAEKLYAAAFDETELDWVFFADNPNLSNSIEWAMYQLSRYDFTTVKGDILTGVYDRFLDRKQRKRFGEYYTPSSVARYILDTMDLSPDDKVLDPACGSGTFLIERYQQVIGEDVDRGLGSFGEVLKALERIYGNDLNTFSSVLAQIQLLWHALSFKDDLIDKGFPDIPISDKGNSIVCTGLDAGQQGRWAEFDTLSFAGVVGNPPYVRPERSGKLDARTTEYFQSNRNKPGQNGSWRGISSKANLYTLFLYKALDSWCNQPDRHGLNAGRLGFVLPLALCGTNENADIRELFTPGGRWTIKEIVDLELIWRHVFDADVLPLILIAEARSPRLALSRDQLSGKEDVSHNPFLKRRFAAARLDDWIGRRIVKARTDDRKTFWTGMKDRNVQRFLPDKVKIKLATKDCIHFEEGVKRPRFDFESITAHEVAYQDLFSRDGRILTRLTPARLSVIRKLEKNAKFETVLETYYYKNRGANRGSVRLDAPNTGQGDWKQREMISRGVKFGGRKQKSAPGRGHTVYKAENIVTGSIFGDPQDTEIDISKANHRGQFAIQAILPECMWAVAGIAVTPNAVSFDPHKIAFTDTATVFIPRKNASDFPFDLFFVSRIVRYYFVLALRMSFLNMIRSHINPTNLRLLPWSDSLLSVSTELETLRTGLVSACEHEYQTEATMRAELNALNLPTLTQAIKAQSVEKVDWSESFRIAAEKIEIAAPVILSQTETGYRVQVSQYQFDWVEVQTHDMAKGIAASLNTRGGEAIDREGVLKLSIPSSAKQLADHQAVVGSFATTDHKAGIEDCMDKIDALVGPALCLSKADIDVIKQDMLSDPFFKNVVPRYPASETRLHGYRTGLDSSDRYG